MHQAIDDLERLLRGPGIGAFWTHTPKFFHSAVRSSGVPIHATYGSIHTGHRDAEQVFTSDQAGSSLPGEGIACGRRTMSEPSKLATTAKGNRSSSRHSATSSEWTP